MRGVMVNAIAPVIVRPDLFRNTCTGAYCLCRRGKIPMGRFLTIPEVAALVAWMASSECSFTTGFTFDISGRTCNLLAREPIGMCGSSAGGPAAPTPITTLPFNGLNPFYLRKVESSSQMGLVWRMTEKDEWIRAKVAVTSQRILAMP